MPKIPYATRRNRIPEDRLEIILWADEVAHDYASRGFSLTLRQLYYQGVKANLYPNTQKSYNRLGDIVSDGRMLGMIDWSHLTDQHREAQSTGWERMDRLPEIADLVRRLENSVAHDLWAGQEYRPEIWVEKDALVQVAQKAAAGFRIPYMACKGYMSQSQMWEAGYNRFGDYVALGQRPVIIHLGDHDPSGIDMTRDIADRLSLFAGMDIEVRRIALNFDQVDEYDLAPNPAKVTDSRFDGYESLYGPSSWELDAIRPEVLVELARAEVKTLIDWGEWNERHNEEDEATQRVRDVADRWDEIARWLDENPR